jgi:SH3-like domain-containing protein
MPAARFWGRFGPASLFQTVALTFVLAALPLAAAPAPAGDDAAPDAQVENAKNSFPGIVTANSVYVRCGPAESYYPTLKLDKGARVTVVGMKLDWLKIIPPDGSFCYISKAFVDRNGDGTAGKVNKDAVNVRAGSTLNALKVVPLCQLSVGMDVKIIGEQDEYYKIEPPAGKAFVYVNKQFVEPDPNAAPTPNQPEKNASVAKNNVGEGNLVKPRAGERHTPTGAQQAQAPATTQPAGEGTEVATSAPPTTRPSAEDVAVVEAEFEKAEAQFAALGTKLEVKPIDELMKQYEKIIAADKLAPTLVQIAENRLETLKIRATSAAELAKAQEQQEQMRKKQVALQAERAELQEQLAQKSVAVYTAVGELQASSLQLGAKTIYRLTDPANGRTVVYLRSDDGKIVTLMGKFIGVKGELTTESQLSLRVIAPTAFEAVDPAKLGKGVTATVVPPSMLGTEGTASTAGHLDARP